MKVVPGASRSAISGWLGDALKVRVAAAPEGGKANAAVETLVAEVLGVPRRAVRVVAGPGSARKVLEIRGLSRAEVGGRLEGHLS